VSESLLFTEDEGGVIYLGDPPVIGEDAEICGTCHRIRATVDGRWRQHCRCEPDQEDREAWKPYDFPTAAELCRCCGTALLRSGSKWACWFCPGCLRLVRAFNARVGRCVIPIGRHTLMNGVGVAATEIEIPVVIDTFASESASLFQKMGFLDDWAAKVVAYNLSAVDRDPSDIIALRRYLALVSGHDGLRDLVAFDRLTAGLSAWIVEGCPPPAGDGH